MKFRWPLRRKEQRRSMLSIADPALASLLAGGPPSYAGVNVTEESALSVSAVYRAVSLISGTVGTLPLRTLREPAPGQRERVASWLDNPGGPDGPTPFEWTRLVLVHLLLHGNAFLVHVRGGAGQMIALVPVHPLSVTVDVATYWPESTRPVAGGKLFRVMLADGSIEMHDASTLTHIPALETDGIRGLSPITVARNGFGTAIAGDRAAARMFDQGALLSGMVSAEGDDVDEDEEDQVRDIIERKVIGWENASGVRFINRRLKFTPWTMSAADAQFIESRAFQIEEIARWFGVPPHLLMQTEKQTSWGTGVAESNRGMGRTVLAPWAALIEQRLSRLLRGDRFVEFDFAGLERPTPEQEIALLGDQIDAGLMTVNEARAIRNLPPVPGGDVLRVKGQPLALPAAPAEGVPA